jgi:hypothetical protein
MPFDLPAVLAGMPMPLVKFSEAARPRLDVISFFLVGLLICAGIVMLVWNSLRKDFAWLPRLTYPKACGVVVLWGLLFVIVLTMISGARELMTPGAWVKQGATYKLRESDQAMLDRKVKQIAERSNRLVALHRNLTAYAEEHAGAFPASPEESGFDSESWELVDVPGTTFLYVASRQTGGPPRPLAYEPQVYDDAQLVLMTNGRVERMQPDEIRRLLEATP